MSDSTPVTAPSRRLPPDPGSVREARRFLETALPAADPDTLYTAQLLTSELVTNAVLHAGTEVEVRAWAAGGRTHVRVSDGVPTRIPVQRDQAPEAGTGRGLYMVEQLSAACGVEVSPHAKTVWFELWPTTNHPKPGAIWAAPRPSPGRGVKVVLVNVPVGLSRAAQRHRAAFLREARLVLISGDATLGVTVDDLREVGALNDLIDSALSRALSEDPVAPTLTVEFEVPEGCAPVAVRLSEVMDILNSAARSGRMLTRPSLPEVRRLRNWLLEEVANQALGGRATPWVGQHDLTLPVPRAETIEFDPADVHARGVPAVAADDDNVILAVNDSAADLLGWDPADLAGERITVMVPPELRERHVAGFTNFLLTGETSIIGTRVQVTALHRDGRSIDIFLTISVEQSHRGRTVFVAELEPVALRAERAS